MQNQERRASGVKRVPVQTLVEICGRVPEVPAFEAESIEVSGRGMHVRTRYLPPVGAPLVLRFEDRGHQILVEGEVSWADTTEQGGEFGIRFTALDSGSVDALRALCAVPPSAVPQAEADEASAAPPARTRVPNGARVHLHIDGMGSTMKAQVRRSGGRAMTVGSKLELLKLGRHLSVEDVDAGERVGAVIDTVDVMVDPQTQVPQLIVSLSYDEPYDDATPAPSHAERAVETAVHTSRPAALSEVDDDVQVAEAAPAGSRAARFELDPEEDDEPDFDTDDEEGAFAEFDGDDEPSALKGKLGVAAVSAGRIAKNTGEALKHVGVSAAASVGGWIKSRRQKQASSKQTAAPPPTLRRQGGAPPRGAAPSSVSSDGRRLRPQSLRGGAASLRGAETQRAGALRAAPPPAKLKRYGAFAGAAVLLSTVAVLALRSPASPTEASLSKGVSAETALAPGDDVTQVDEQGDPIVAGETKSKTTSDGISADVPLFGPTPMATSEAAPIDDEEEAEGNALGAGAAVDDTPPVEDETWDDQPAAKAPEAAKPTIDPSKVPPWGRGKVTRPTIHRIRLDGPGGAIQGAINPTGFAVVIPGRKVMEDGAGITKRDKRIARVRTTNVGGGAQVTFQFKDGIPGYRVRLRKDFVEFLISEPTKSGSLATR